MSIVLYDDALLNKINKWFKDRKMKILNPNQAARLFQMRADQSNDAPLTLPFLALSREDNIELTNVGKCSLSYDGRRLDNSDNLTIKLDAIPMELTYRLDIYTKAFEDADGYLRNLLFQIINHPKMVVEIKYNNVNLQHVCNLRLDTTISNTSDSAERLFPDEFVRLSLTIHVDDAYFFSVPVEENGKIVGTEIDIQQKTEENNDYHEIENIDSNK